MALFNVAAANDAVVKYVHYISEMSQNCECFNRRGEGAGGEGEWGFRASMQGRVWNIFGTS